MMISDLITFRSTNSITIMEELRIARREYWATPATQAQPLSREQRTINRISPTIMEELRRVPLAQRYQTNTITRVCLRLGISPTQTLRLTRTLRV